MDEPLMIEALRAMAERLRPKATTPLEEALTHRPVVILKGDVEGLIAIRIAPGKAALLARNPEEIAGKLRREGFVVATGQDAREIAGSIAQAASMGAWTSNPLLRAAIEHRCAIDRARFEIELLRDIVGAEQVERALWWAGPDLGRLHRARALLAEGRTLDERKGWSEAPRMAAPEELRAALRSVL